MSEPKYKCRPLSMRFMARCYTTNEGLAWLQDRGGWISDNCVTLADVAEVDEQRVCAAFDAYWRRKATPEPEQPMLLEVESRQPELVWD